MADQGGRVGIKAPKTKPRLGLGHTRTKNMTENGSVSVLLSREVVRLGSETRAVPDWADSTLVCHWRFLRR